jgi:hypothetical protein
VGRLFQLGLKMCEICRKPDDAGGKEGCVKRYLIFALLGPLIGGFLLLIANTYAAGYWDQTSPGEVATLFKVFVSTLQYTYMFGILPALMLGAIDDIIWHIKRVPAVARMLIVGAIAFVTTLYLYGALENAQGARQVLLFGIVGLVPAMLSSWWAHKVYDREQVA